MQREMYEANWEIAVQLISYYITGGQITGGVYCVKHLLLKEPTAHLMNGPERCKQNTV